MNDSAELLDFVAPRLAAHGLLALVLVMGAALLQGCPAGLLLPQQVNVGVLTARRDICLWLAQQDE